MRGIPTRTRTHVYTRLLVHVQEQEAGRGQGVPTQEAQAEALPDTGQGCSHRTNQRGPGGLLLSTLWGVPPCCAARLSSLTADSCCPYCCPSLHTAAVSSLCITVEQSFATELGSSPPTAAAASWTACNPRPLLYLGSKRLFCTEALALYLCAVGPPGPLGDWNGACGGTPGTGRRCVSLPEPQVCDTRGACCVGLQQTPVRGSLFVQDGGVRGAACM